MKCECFACEWRGERDDPGMCACPICAAYPLQPVTPFNQFQETLRQEFELRHWGPSIENACEEELFRLRRQAQLIPSLLKAGG